RWRGASGGSELASAGACSGFGKRVWMGDGLGLCRYLTKDIGALQREAGLVAIPAGCLCIHILPVVGKMVEKHCTFLHRSDRIPDCLVGCLVELRQEAVGRESVPRMTSKAYRAFSAHAQQCSVTLGTSEQRGCAEVPDHRGPRRIVGNGDLRL